MGKHLLRLSERFELLVVGVLLVILMLLLLVGALDLVYLFARNVGDRLGEITDATMLQQRLHMAFGGVLILLLGLELMATVRMYLKEHVIHVEAVFLVAMIAVARQVIELDYAHASVGVLVGIAAILLALSGGYFLLRKSGIRGVLVVSSQSQPGITGLSRRLPWSNS